MKVLLKIKLKNVVLPKFFERREIV